MINWIKKLIKELTCDHDMEVLHRDNACSLERCKKCNHEIIYGKP